MSVRHGIGLAKLGKPSKWIAATRVDFASEFFSAKNRRLERRGKEGGKRWVRDLRSVWVGCVCRLEALIEMGAFQLEN